MENRKNTEKKKSPARVIFNSYVTAAFFYIVLIFVFDHFQGMSAFGRIVFFVVFFLAVILGWKIFGKCEKSKIRLNNRKGFKSVLASNVLLFSFFAALILTIDMLESFSGVVKLIASVLLFFLFIFLSYLIGRKIDGGVKVRSQRRG